MAKHRNNHKMDINKMIAGFAFFVAFLFSNGYVKYESMPKEYPIVEQKEPVAVGVDLSTWQTDINAKKLHKDGYTFGIIRVGYGLNEDDEFESHYKALKSAKMDIGAYYYSLALDEEDAVNEALHCIEVIGNKKFSYPIYYDIEDAIQNDLSNEELSNIAKAFCETMEDAGYYVGIYANNYMLSYRFDHEIIQDYDIWIANYTDYLDYDGAYSIWQYTSSGVVNGIDGHVDLNVSYKDFPEIIKTLHFNNY